MLVINRGTCFISPFDDKLIDETLYGMPMKHNPDVRFASEYTLYWMRNSNVYTKRKLVIFVPKNKSLTRVLIFELKPTSC